MVTFHRWSGKIEGAIVELVVERLKEESPLTFAENSTGRKVEAALYAGLWLCPLWSLSSVRPHRCLIRWDGSTGNVSLILESLHNGHQFQKSWRLGPGQSLEHVQGVVRAWGLACSAVAAQMELPLDFSDQPDPPFET